jgi:hypothetical protein
MFFCLGLNSFLFFEEERYGSTVRSESIRASTALDARSQIQMAKRTVLFFLELSCDW